MPTTPPPNLGYGKATEVTLDQFNQYMRSSPWYQSLIKSFGQDPNNVHLSDSQKKQVIRAAQANGAVIDEGKQEVDDSGNFRNESHKLRNTLIVAGIAGATIATMGAAGVFAGAAGASAGAGTGAAAGGTLASTTTVPLMAGTIAGSTASGAVPAALAAGGTLGSTVGLGGTIGGGLSAASRFLGSPAGSSLVGTAANIFGNIYGANKQADANSEAARLADEATKRAEQFSREQAEGGWQSNEHTQKANYDQWRARQNAIMDSLGNSLGIVYTPPEYSPGIDPRYTGGGDSSAGASSGSSASSETSGADPAMAAFIKDYQSSHPASEGIAPLAAALKDKGFKVDRFMYGATPSDNELSVNGQKYKVLGGENSPAAYWYSPGMNDGGGGAPAGSGGPPARRERSLLATFTRPNFVPLPTPYQPGTLGAYVGS